MQRLPLVLSLLLLPALAACEGCTPPTPPGEDQVPFRDEWKTVIDGAVLPGECPLGTVGCECGAGSSCMAGSCQPTSENLDFCVDPGAGPGNKGGACDEGNTCKPGLVCAELDAAPGQFVCVDVPTDTVTSLTIGGVVSTKNFANRGNIEVFFDGKEGQVTVQMRKFTEAADQDEAQGNWDSLIPWVYSATLAPPGDEIAPDDCSQAFRDGCMIRVWYNGQTQPARDGADIRVILPPSYTGHLDIVTEDNIASTDYPDRGDVTIKDLRGTADIEVDSGNVSITLADDVLEAPKCGAEAVEACENYEDPEDMMPAPWDKNCGCTDFGKVRVESRAERASNITVDAPGDLWATARNMENQQPGLTKDSDPLCTAEVDCDGFGSCTDIGYDPAFPWKRTTELNDPGESALAGVGYSLGDLISAACQNVTFVEGPEDFGEEPRSETRGQLRVCSGCLDLPGH